MELVIDTDFVCSAGDPSHTGADPTTDPRAHLCALALQAAYLHRHVAVVSDQLDAEWRAHPSRFGRKWRVRMESRDAIVYIGDCSDAALRERVAAAVGDGADAALNDMHLIEAALRRAAAIVSLNRRERERFAQASADIEELRPLVWTPRAEDELKRVPAWLAAGAPPEDELRLGYGVAGVA